MKFYSASVLAICLVNTACSHDSQPPSQTVLAPRSVSVSRTYDENVPPTRKEILRALFSNQDVSLSTDSSCSGVGTEPADANIGDYISGFLAEQNSDKGKNWLEVAAKRAPVPGVEPLWNCDVVIRHEDGEDRWGWGVSFQMKAKDHSTLKTSFRCTGSG